MKDIMLYKNDVKNLIEAKIWLRKVLIKYKVRVRITEGDKNMAKGEKSSNKQIMQTLINRDIKGDKNRYINVVS
ncbi:MAG: hypothetical protein MJ245_04625 [Clostridia bacterium]|nr:hypothetical protein [Clostridia bacterium]